ncbi:MAG: guanylate kinase [Saprospiraceae bacterium]|nr:guanylate kinase [Saprospiraceae bacterium]
MKKLIIVTAPSGAGKTTIVHHLLRTFPGLAFSVSATNRARRSHEVDGLDYYFLSTAEFKQRVTEGAFLEFEEVYDDQYYGTLKSEMERLWSLGKCIIFDVDVKGATNIKNAYPNESLAIFIKPPSKEILMERLKNRKTETTESLRKRIARATEELTYEERFDKVVVNDVLERAFKEAENVVRAFIGQKDLTAA